ncbi:predicted protein [Nematostella vectensis]|uniref:Transforming growth factor beta receptor type 3-like protein n=1 Tax=Nematostella vectensis TaxID=45351 RepID=A7RTL9_NEMVE|nr:transforming growth factor beta receptor type 3-like protein [Nematostella vectensis]EDO45235.1 predicted protein [Nematostella vectensis]|eukprot:XP_001637298.1 predicted protein [Nematostella vectensis]
MSMCETGIAQAYVIGMVWISVLQTIPGAPLSREIGVTVTCTPTSIRVELSRKVYPRLQASHIRMLASDASCQPRQNKTHFTLESPLDSCGTAHAYEYGMHVFSNVVQPGTGSSIGIKCKYPMYQLRGLVDRGLLGEVAGQNILALSAPHEITDTHSIHINEIIQSDVPDIKDKTAPVVLAFYHDANFSTKLSPRSVVPLWNDTIALYLLLRLVGSGWKAQIERCTLRVCDKHKMKCQKETIMDQGCWDEEKVQVLLNSTNVTRFVVRAATHDAAIITIQATCSLSAWNETSTGTWNETSSKAWNENSSKAWNETSLAAWSEYVTALNKTATGAWNEPSTSTWNENLTMAGEAVLKRTWNESSTRAWKETLDSDWNTTLTGTSHENITNVWDEEQIQRRKSDPTNSIQLTNRVTPTRRLDCRCSNRNHSRTRQYGNITLSGIHGNSSQGNNSNWEFLDNSTDHLNTTLLNCTCDDVATVTRPLKCLVRDHRTDSADRDLKAQTEILSLFSVGQWKNGSILAADVILNDTNITLNYTKPKAILYAKPRLQAVLEKEAWLYAMLILLLVPVLALFSWRRRRRMRRLKDRASRECGIFNAGLVMEDEVDIT